MIKQIKGACPNTNELVDEQLEINLFRLGTRTAGNASFKGSKDRMLKLVGIVRWK